MITKIFAVVFTVAYICVSIWLCRKFRFDVKSLALGAIAIALTCILACIYIPLPTGASITCCSWVPLMLLAIIYDYRLAIISGFVCGIITIFVVPGWSIVHWAQFFLEYVPLFSCMGYAGILGYEKKGRLILAIALAVVLRMTAQILSGVIFFGAYAWEGWGAWAYSLIYHFTSKIPEGIISALVLLALPLDRLAKIAKGGAR